jgi:hypothetical protein
MHKIFTSIIISIVVAFLGANLISKTSKFKWEMILSYEHIANSYDVEFSVLSKKLNINPLDQFNMFMQKLDAKVSLMDSKNPCSKVRTTATQPNILVSLDNIGQLNVMIRSENKKLLIQCEKYIDLELEKFEIFTNNFIKNINENLEEQVSAGFYNYAQQNVLQNQAINEFEMEAMLESTLQNIIVDNKNNNRLDETTLKELSQTLKVLGQLYYMKPGKIKGTLPVAAEKIPVFDIIKKESRQMIYKKDSTKLLGFSIYIILQTIFLMFFFSGSTYARERKIKKKIYNFFN